MSGISFLKPNVLMNFVVCGIAWIADYAKLIDSLSE
jgi:hypothetical protein